MYMQGPLEQVCSHDGDRHLYMYTHITCEDSRQDKGKQSRQSFPTYMYTYTTNVQYVYIDGKTKGSSYN